MKKAIIFGIGNHYQYLKEYIFDEYFVVALADNNPDKQGMVFDRFPVICPCSIPELTYDYVLILPQGDALSSIKKQLLDIGVLESKIMAYDKTLSPFVIDPVFFSKDLTYERKKQLFKDNVELLFIECSSQCNRHCWMCTNSTLDRHTKNIKLKHDILVKVLTELSEIDYEGDISLSAFNEPMMDRDLDKNILLIKKYLPNAPVHFNTNGDFLNRERLDDLEQLDLDFLPVSLYIDTIDKPWNYPDSVSIIKQKVQSLGLEIQSISPENDTITNATCKYKSLYVLFRCANHRIVAGDRCGSVPDAAPVRRFERAARVCDRFFDQFTINYSGVVTACCNFHPDFIGHNYSIMGNVHTDSIYDIFSCDAWTQLRKTHIANIDALPCNTCGIISDVWGDTMISVLPFMPFKDRPRYRKYRVE